MQLHFLIERRQPSFICPSAVTTNAPTTRPHKGCTLALITRAKNISSLALLMPVSLWQAEFSHQHEYQQKCCGCEKSIKFFIYVTHTYIYELHGFWFTIMQNAFHKVGLGIQNVLCTLTGILKTSIFIKNKSVGNNTLISGSQRLFWKLERVKSCSSLYTCTKSWLAFNYFNDLECLNQR